MTVHKAANGVGGAPGEDRLQHDERRPGRVRLSLPPLPASIGEARRAVDEFLDAEPGSDLGPRLKLVISELMTNAVTHGAPGEPIALRLTLYVRHAHVSVYNAGPAIEMASFRRERTGGGRGLTIVAALVDGWSIETGPRGTTVTARVPRASG